MAKIIPEKIPLDELNRFTDEDNGFFDEAEKTFEAEEPFEETETYEHLEETEIDSKFRKIIDAFYKFKTDKGWVADRSALSKQDAKIVRNPITKHIYVDYDGKKIRITSKKKYIDFFH